MSARQNTAIIVVDMQEKFIGDMDYLEKGRLVSNHVTLLEHCREENIPVVGLRYVGYGDYNTLVDDAFQKYPARKIFMKKFNDGFTNKNFDRYISSLDVKRLVFTGVNADFCVRHTAHSALDKGFRIATSKDLIANATFSGSIQHAYRWFETNGHLFDRYPDLLRTF